MQSQTRAQTPGPETTLESQPVAEAKRPYETPRLRTGAAFENVLLASGCNPTAFCPPPKCG